MLFRILFKAFRQTPPRRVPQHHRPKEDEPLPRLRVSPAPQRPTAARPHSGFPSREERADKARALYAKAIDKPGTTLKGKCHVIDGDTIVINHTHIRLAGIDAPELDQPFGQKSKWALVHMVKGQEITAAIHCEMSYDRIVATCTLPDGRDIAAELVRQGLALDWPTFSKGKYAHLEPTGARKKLWRAHARQGRGQRLVDKRIARGPA